MTAVATCKENPSTSDRMPAYAWPIRLHIGAETTYAAGIGFVEANFPVDRLPGWEARTYGYHGDDGKVSLHIAITMSPGA